MLSLLTGRAGAYLGAATLILALLGAVYWVGGKDARREVDDLKADRETREVIDNADPDFAECAWHRRLLNDCPKQ